MRSTKGRSRRRYRLGRRAQTTAATRQRIVEATMALHDEQGITGTSIRDVAGRAAVAPATVLRHFPRLDDLLAACGELSEQLAPMPTEAIFVGATTARERVRRLAEALFGWWQLLGPGWDHLQVDRRTLRRVDDWLRDVAIRHRALAAAAIGPRAGAVDVALATALTSQGAWRSLHDAGLDPPEAARQVTRMLTASLGTRKDVH